MLRIENLTVVFIASALILGCASTSGVLKINCPKCGSSFVIGNDGGKI
jgi:hypothetical protein